MSNPSAETGIALIRSLRKGSIIARALGITPQAVSQWDKVPAEYVVIAEEASGISREELRPDLYRHIDAKEHQAIPAGEENARKLSRRTARASRAIAR